MQILEIQPFKFIRGTAFSERVQLANKVNEIIDGINQISDVPDLKSQITQLTTKISELEESIGNTDTSLADLENQMNALISEVNTTIKQSISTLESEVDGIDGRLTTAEDTISEHGTEIDGLLKEVIDGVVMSSTAHGTVQVQINHEDGSKDISTPIDLGLVEEGGIVLQSGTTDRSFKLIVTLTDGTSWQTNDFVIPEGGGTEVSVTNISIAQGTGTNKIQVKIGLSDGSTISSNDWTVVTPSEFSALRTRVTTAEGKITKNTRNISDLDSRLQTLEDSPSFTVQPATATTLGGVKIGANVKVQADGTISVDLSSYALKTEIPDVSGFVTAEDVAADYQPKGNYLTTLPIASVTRFGCVRIGNGLYIGTDGTINVSSSSAAEFAPLIPPSSNTIDNSVIRSWIAAYPNSILFISGYVADQNEQKSGYTKFVICTKPLTSDPENIKKSDPENNKKTGVIFYQCWGENWITDTASHQTITRLYDTGEEIFAFKANYITGRPLATLQGSGFRLTIK